MTLDLDTTYFPNAARDNFGKPFGQNMYNWQWFIGDRTSIISYGWFEFWDIGGQPIYNTNIARHNDPFGLNVITSGISMSPPAARQHLHRLHGHRHRADHDLGPEHQRSATGSAPSGTGRTRRSYDFGNAILLASMFSFTRIGADYLTSVGLTVDPQRQSYMFAVRDLAATQPEHPVRLGRRPEPVRLAVRPDAVRSRDEPPTARRAARTERGPESAGGDLP